MTRTDYNALNKVEKKEAKVELYETVKTALEGEGTKEKILKSLLEAKEAMKILRPSLYGERGFGTGGGKPAKYIEFAKMFENIGDTVDELELFKVLKVGRKETRTLIKQGLKKALLDERKWISFDPETEIYELIKIGAEAPEDWTGYLPIEEMEEEVEEEVEEDEMEEEVEDDDML